MRAVIRVLPPTPGGVRSISTARGRRCFVEARARQLYRALSRDHGKVAEVAHLGDAVAALRPAAVA